MYFQWIPFNFFHVTFVAGPLYTARPQELRIHSPSILPRRIPAQERLWLPDLGPDESTTLCYGIPANMRTSETFSLCNVNPRIQLLVHFLNLHSPTLLQLWPKQEHHPTFDQFDGWFLVPEKRETQLYQEIMCSKRTGNIL